MFVHTLNIFLFLHWEINYYWHCLLNYWFFFSFYCFFIINFFEIITSSCMIKKFWKILRDCGYDEIRLIIWYNIYFPIFPLNFFHFFLLFLLLFYWILDENLPSCFYIRQFTNYIFITPSDHSSLYFLSNIFTYLLIYSSV